MQKLRVIVFCAARQFSTKRASPTIRSWTSSNNQFRSFASAPASSSSSSSSSPYYDVDGIPTINIADAKSRMKNFDLIVDVRELDEIQQGMIDDAKHIPMKSAISGAQSKEISSLTKNKKVLLYCRGGVRSATVAKSWRAAGIDAVNLAGGFSKWNV